MRTTVAVLTSLVMSSLAQADDATDTAVATAIEKGLRRIETGASSYPKHRQCFSCHHQALPVFMASAKQRGFAVDSDLLKRQVDFSMKSFRNRSVIAQGRGVGGDSTGVVYALHTFAVAERPYDETTAALLQYLLVVQRADGSWPIAPFGDRPPTMGSLFTNVGLAMFVLKTFGPPKEAPDSTKLQERIDTATIKGRDWLLSNQPITTEDKVFHLRGLVDAGAPIRAIEGARQRLMNEQRDNGSWSQLERMSGDAYASATVLFALRRAGLNSSHEVHRRGIKYLLESQQEDGAWIVQTRSRPLQMFFDNGDPGGKSQFISFAATNWAVLALLETIPVVADEDGKR